MKNLLLVLCLLVLLQLSVYGNESVKFAALFLETVKYHEKNDLEAENFFFMPFGGQMGEAIYYKTKNFDDGKRKWLKIPKKSYVMELIFKHSEQIISSELPVNITYFPAEEVFIQAITESFITEAEKNQFLSDSWSGVYILIKNLAIQKVTTIFLHLLKTPDGYKIYAPWSTINNVPLPIFLGFQMKGDKLIFPDDKLKDLTSYIAQKKSSNELKKVKPKRNKNSVQNGAIQW